jgi:hypothetical protein
MHSESALSPKITAEHKPTPALRRNASQPILIIPPSNTVSYISHTTMYDRAISAHIKEEQHDLLHDGFTALPQNNVFSPTRMTPPASITSFWQTFSACP